MLYKNKNDEFNAIKYMVSQLSYLATFAFIKLMRHNQLNGYLIEELPKVIDLLKKKNDGQN
jgi:hypothetical protein